MVEGYIGKRKAAIFSPKQHSSAFKGTITKNIVNTQSMRLIPDNRKHFLEIQLNREINTFYPVLISIWTQKDICWKCLWKLSTWLTNAASGSTFFSFSQFHRKRIFIIH